MIFKDGSSIFIKIWYRMGLLSFCPFRIWACDLWKRWVMAEWKNFSWRPWMVLKNNSPSRSYKLFCLSILSVLPRKILCLMIKWTSCIWNTIIVYLYPFYSINVAPFNQFISLFGTWVMLKKKSYIWSCRAGVGTRGFLYKLTSLNPILS